MNNASLTLLKITTKSIVEERRLRKNSAMDEEVSGSLTLPNLDSDTRFVEASMSLLATMDYLDVIEHSRKGFCTRGRAFGRVWEVRIRVF